MFAKVFKYWVFAAVVAVPTAVAIIYYTSVASDIFVSESRYIVRSAERAESPSLGSLIKGGAMGPATDNAGVVRDYALSREALFDVQSAVDMKAAFSSASVDPIKRFPGLFEANNFETFFEHYKRYVSVAIDPVSATSTLSVRAFDPRLAHDINVRLLEGAERVVNEMNRRMQRDMVDAAAHEVEIAEARVRAAEIAVARFRAERGVLNPEQEAVMQLQRADRLREALLEAETRLEQVRVAAPDSPQIPVLAKQVALVKEQIRATKARTGRGDKSLVTNSAEFQRLTIERELAAKALAITMDRLDRAQTEAARKQVYLARIAPPSMPDGALEPRRIRGPIAVFVISLLVWGVLTLLVSGVREHKEVL